MRTVNRNSIYSTKVRLRFRNDLIRNYRSTVVALELFLITIRISIFQSFVI